ncbi:hypothetical protein LguiB_027680 [Lonicera macranthoides]
MAIMEEKLESSRQYKAENVKITIDDQFQSMKMKFSQYIVKDPKPVVACNYKVPNYLRKGKEDAYTLGVVSIGPIHYGKPHLQAMERSKRMFLAWYLERSSALSLDDMVRVAIDIEDKARMSYLERFDNISNQEFSQMIILDFIFLIEFFVKFVTNNEQSIPLEDSNLVDIVGDTILLENQFPKHLVTHLFHILYKEHNLGNLILNYLMRIVPMRSFDARPNDFSSASNMLDFLVMCHDGKIEGTIRSEIMGTWLKRARSATELREAGVQFSKVVDTTFLLDVKFVNGVLIMPVIEIDIFFETCFQNMKAFEQSRCDKPERVNGYIYLLSNLIRSPKDVDLLSNCGIIEHPHHNVEQVLSLFRDVGKGAVISTTKCYFWAIYLEMHAYSRNYWHQWKGSWFKWKRMLREDYFSSPWSIISVVPAFILLVLTVIQTVYAIKQK